MPYNAPLLNPWIKEWWAYVTVKPEDNSITVLSKGSSKGLTDSIPLGGHWAPISTAGDKALWKKVQKIAKKNNASLTINKATPIFSPLCTARVWLPKYVASLITSLNQNDIEHISKTKPNIKNSCAAEKPCIVKTPEVVRANRETQVKIGQGEGETRWNGWAWKLLLIKFVMLLLVLYTRTPSYVYEALTLININYTYCYFLVVIGILYIRTFSLKKKITSRNHDF